MRQAEPGAADSERRSAPKALRQEIELRAFGPAGLGFDVSHLGEIGLQDRQQTPGFPTLECLREEGSAGLERAHREVHSRLDQADDAQVIGLAVARGVGRHVRDDQIRFAAQAFQETRATTRIGEVALQYPRPRKGLQRQEVDTDDGSGASLHGDLQPAAGGATKIDHATSVSDQMKPVINFAELECSAGSVALCPSLGDKGIVDLALKPGLR
jgi:hypothetical protein